jgi:2-polyprenyl-3-methyl-5-hydroxy-6-metoxy-1,4-benzoquinol methylase
MSNTTTQAAKTPTMDQQREFWASHWRQWKERKVINEWSALRSSRILDWLSSLGLQNPKILDLGCGIGWFSEMLASLGQVTGVDLSEDAIAQARARCPQARFFAANILAEKFPDGDFDVAVSQEVIAHVEDQARYIQRAAELLRPGGYLIITTANKLVFERVRGGFYDYPPEHIEVSLDMKALKRLLQPHFNVLRSDTINPVGNKGVLRLVNSPKLNTALQLFLKPESLTALKEHAGFGYDLIVLAQKPLAGESHG